VGSREAHRPNAAQSAECGEVAVGWRAELRDPSLDSKHTYETMEFVVFYSRRIGDVRQD